MKLNCNKLTQTKFPKDFIQNKINKKKKKGSAKIFVNYQKIHFVKDNGFHKINLIL